MASATDVQFGSMYLIEITMIDITLEGGYVTFTTSVIGAIASNVELCEVVDENCLHLGTNVGVFLNQCESVHYQWNQIYQLNQSS